jgi:ribosomal protein L37AE/L43A
MSLGRREARHETVAAARTAGVRPEDYWDFKPGQKVMTADGFPGVVATVEDGPFAGGETYIVDLDNGLGGGQYTASLLRAMPQAKANVEHKTAADDYPELADILVDRPPLAMTTRASLNKHAAGTYTHNGERYCSRTNLPVAMCDCYDYEDAPQYGPKRVPHPSEPGHAEAVEQRDRAYNAHKYEASLQTTAWDKDEWDERDTWEEPRCEECGQEGHEASDHQKEAGRVRNLDDAKGLEPSARDRNNDIADAYKRDEYSCKECGSGAHQTGNCPDLHKESAYDHGDPNKYTAPHTCPSCGSDRALESANGVIKCEDCGYEQQNGDTDGYSKVAASGLPPQPVTNKPGMGATCIHCGYGHRDSKPGDECVLCGGQMSAHPEKHVAGKEIGSDQDKAKHRHKGDQAPCARGGCGHPQGIHGDNGATCLSQGCDCRKFTTTPSQPSDSDNTRDSDQSSQNRKDARRKPSHSRHPGGEYPVRGAGWGYGIWPTYPNYYAQGDFDHDGDDDSDSDSDGDSGGGMSSEAALLDNLDPTLTPGNEPRPFDGSNGAWGATTPPDLDANPGSTGWASGADPKEFQVDSSSFGRMGSLEHDWPRLRTVALPLGPVIKNVLKGTGKEMGKQLPGGVVDAFAPIDPKHDTGWGQNAPRGDYKPAFGQEMPKWLRMTDEAISPYSYLPEKFRNWLPNFTEDKSAEGTDARVHPAGYALNLAGNGIGIGAEKAYSAGEKAVKGIGDAAKNVGHDFSEAGAQARDNLQHNWKSLTRGVGDVGKSINNGFTKPLADGAGIAGNAIGHGVADAAKALVHPFGSGAGKAMQGAGNAVTKGVSKGWHHFFGAAQADNAAIVALIVEAGAVKEIGKGIDKAFGDVDWGKWADEMGDWGAGAAHGVEDAASGIAHGVGDVAKGVGHGVEDAASTVKGWAGDLFGGGKPKPRTSPENFAPPVTAPPVKGTPGTGVPVKPGEVPAPATGQAPAAPGSVKPKAGPGEGEAPKPNPEGKEPNPKGKEPGPKPKPKPKPKVRFPSIPGLPAPDYWAESNILRTQQGIGSRASLDSHILNLLDQAHAEEEQAYQQRFAAVETTLHEEPEAALPQTDGERDDLDDLDSPTMTASLQGETVGDILANFQATAAASGLLSGGSSVPSEGMDGIASMAAAYLATGQMPEDPAGGMQATAMKAFTPGEQKQIIDEGMDVTASNLDRLDIAGTHYEALDGALASMGSPDEDGDLWT